MLCAVFAVPNTLKVQSFWNAAGFCLSLFSTLRETTAILLWCDKEPGGGGGEPLHFFPYSFFDSHRKTTTLVVGFPEGVKGGGWQGIHTCSPFSHQHFLSVGFWFFNYFFPPVIFFPTAVGRIFPVPNYFQMHPRNNLRPRQMGPRSNVLSGITSR